MAKHYLFVGSKYAEAVGESTYQEAVLAARNYFHNHPKIKSVSIYASQGNAKMKKVGEIGKRLPFR